jgi:hypothetical protein
VWELAESRSIAIEHNPEHAGHAVQTIFVDDFDTRVAEIAARGVEPSKRETYPNGVRKATYRDLDGNEIGIGGAPIRASSSNGGTRQTLPDTAPASPAAPRT